MSVQTQDGDSKFLAVIAQAAEDGVPDAGKIYLVYLLSGVFALAAMIITGFVAATISLTTLVVCVAVFALSDQVKAPLMRAALTTSGVKRVAVRVADEALHVVAALVTLAVISFPPLVISLWLAATVCEYWAKAGARHIGLPVRW